jgi:hypothetical protein
LLIVGYHADHPKLVHKACGLPPRGQARRCLSTAGFCLALIPHSTSTTIYGRTHQYSIHQIGGITNEKGKMYQVNIDEIEYQPHFIT